MADRNLILVELNEVPYRVIDWYTRERPGSTLARILPQCAQYQTLTEDKIALDPWISWPTLHRGVNDEMHGILHLGQADEETDSRFPPVWRILKARGLQVGVFGSLHSSSIPADAADYRFYLPDYFDAKVFAQPASLLPFQELNLVMTRQSARNVTRKMPLGTLARFLATAPAAGLRLATLADSAGQLVHETFDRSSRIRRRAYQPLVMADLFVRQLQRSLPHFATFYTNHVAAAMHRYWGAAFPEDYAQPLETQWIRRYGGEIRFAMDKFDVILRQLTRFVDTYPQYVLLIASSMGQAAVAAQRTDQFLTVTDPGRLMARLGVPPAGWEERPAMVPVRCLVVREGYRDQVLAGLESVGVADAQMRRNRRPVGPLSYDERDRGFFQVFVQIDNYRGPDSVRIGGQSVPLAEAGLGMLAHEDNVNCTAQHVPAGSLISYCREPRGRPAHGREQISTLDVVPSIMKLFGLETPAYMRGRAAVALG